MDRRWRRVGEDWLLVGEDEELGRVHEQLLGWSWVVRNPQKGFVMGMAPSRLDAMQTVEHRLGIADRQQTA